MLILFNGMCGDVKKMSFVLFFVLKCLDYVLSGNKDVCNCFIDGFGLKSLFFIFMGCNAKAVCKMFGNEVVFE